MLLSPQRAKLNVQENLRRLLSDRGLTQSELADKSGVSQGFVSKLCNGRAIASSLDLKNIADALEVSSDDLIDDPRLGF